MSTQNNMKKMLNRKNVEEITGLSRSSIYAYMHRGLFPRQIHIGIKKVGWDADEITLWIQDRIDKRNQRCAL